MMWRAWFSVSRNLVSLGRGGSETTLFASNTWGEDLDARRNSRSATIAGWVSNSIRSYHPMVDETSPSSMTERTWIWAVLGGHGCGRGAAGSLGVLGPICVTMTKMKIFVAPDGSVKARVIGGAKTSVCCRVHSGQRGQH